MLFKYGDSVVRKGYPNKVGIVQNRDNSGTIAIRFLSAEVFRTERIAKANLIHVAELIAESYRGKKRYRNLTLDGGGTLGELVSAFGYTAQYRLRGETLERVQRQLRRAGLRLICEEATQAATFRLDMSEVAETESKPTPSTQLVTLPDPFWPTIFGLRQNELWFLRSLQEPAPILCLLDPPSRAIVYPWLQATWEGLIIWAYLAAQRFGRGPFPTDDSLVRILPDVAIQHYERESMAPTELRLNDAVGHLNLVTLSRGTEARDFSRLKARWPGPVFYFHPEFISEEGQYDLPALKGVLDLICLAGGSVPGTEGYPDRTPLSLVIWARQSHDTILAASTSFVPRLLASSPGRAFAGSHESGTALQLKAFVDAWVRRSRPSAKVSFEESDDVFIDEECEERNVRRVDIKVADLGIFEIETMRSSGPFEVFCARKVFSRLDTALPFHLVVPGESLLWAGPFLADVAAKLGSHGKVLVPLVERHGEVEAPSMAALNGRDLVLDLEGRELSPEAQAVEAAPDERITLSDIAGYRTIVDFIQEEVIWVRRNPRIARACSRSSGMLFFGPPGCGKSRLARAICGELDQEVRLLGPSDLRGLYIGWGQAMIRDQFDWLFEEPDRVLLIDEFDAVARSRTSAQMHADEKADVNELLVQLDRAGQRGNLVLCTTNFVSSLDEAVIRSGRFSHFIPVPPPDAEAAADIVAYYLGRLGRAADGALLGDLHVETPDRATVTGLVQGVFECRRKDEGWLCGADLEAAVNAAFRAKARAALAESGQPVLRSSERLVVRIEAGDLGKALMDARRSVSADSVTRFLADLKAHSSSSIYEEYRTILTT